MRSLFLFISLCLCSPAALAAGPMYHQNDSRAGWQQYAQASCPASDLAKVLKLPRVASQNCKDAFKEMRYSCHLGESTCEDCEKATGVFNDACNPLGELSTDFDCDADSECGLVDTDCDTAYDPTSVNRERIVQVLRRNGWPKMGCPRNGKDKQRFHAACIEHQCRVQTSDD